MPTTTQWDDLDIVLDGFHALEGSFVGYKKKPPRNASAVPQLQLFTSGSTPQSCITEFLVLRRESINYKDGNSSQQKDSASATATAAAAASSSSSPSHSPSSSPPPPSSSSSSSARRSTLVVMPKRMGGGPASTLLTGAEGEGKKERHSVDEQEMTNVASLGTSSPAPPHGADPSNNNNNNNNNKNTKFPTTTLAPSAAVPSAKRRSRIKQLSSSLRSFEVHVVWSYPLPTYLVNMRFANIANFVYANEDASFCVNSSYYTFVLTDSNGIRQYGHCRASVNGETIVIMSPYPWCNFFSHIAYLYAINGPIEGQEMIRAICKCPTPPSGCLFNVTFKSMTFRRPYDRLCTFIDTSPLDLIPTFPDTDTLFSLLADLLLEKHVAVVGPNFNMVSNIIISLQALLSPFEWPHILIPIVPTHLLDVLSAPPPYLCGIITSQMPIVRQLPLGSLVLVHINAAGVCEEVEYINEDHHTLPHSGTFSGLRLGYTLLKLRDPRDQTLRDLLTHFMCYYATLFGELGVRGAKGYIKSKGLARDVQFYEILLNTQCFNLLSEGVSAILENVDSTAWVDNEFIVAAVRAHPDVYPRQWEYLEKEESSGGGYRRNVAQDAFGSLDGDSGEPSSMTFIRGFGGHRISLVRLMCRILSNSCCSSGNDSQMVVDVDDLGGENVKYTHLGKKKWKVLAEMTTELENRNVEESIVVQEAVETTTTAPSTNSAAIPQATSTSTEQPTTANPPKCTPSKDVVIEN